MQYPVELKEDDGFLVVTFPDVPEAITQGTDVKDALRHAADALETALDFYVEDGRPFPKPTKPLPDQPMVDVRPSYVAKAMLRQEMREQKVTRKELARRLQVKPQEVTLLLNLRHTSRIDGIARALKVIGKTMEIRTV
jgi:antitoxin HicB